MKHCLATWNTSLFFLLVLAAWAPARAWASASDQVPADFLQVVCEPTPIDPDAQGAEAGATEVHSAEGGASSPEAAAADDAGADPQETAADVADGHRRAAEQAAQHPAVAEEDFEAPAAADPDTAGAVPQGSRGHGQGPSRSVGSRERDEVLASAHDHQQDGCQVSETCPRISEMTRHVGRWSDDLWCNSPEGTSLGVVRREYYRQVYRQTYQFFDQQGQAQGRATQPFASLGLFSRKLQSLYVDDANGQRRVSLKGLFFTWAPIKYIIEDDQGTRLLDVQMDRKRQSILFTPPNNPRVRVAALLREQQASVGNDRWRVMLFDPSVLDFPTWSLINAFFINLASPSTPRQGAGD